MLISKCYVKNSLFLALVVTEDIREHVFNSENKAWKESMKIFKMFLIPHLWRLWHYGSHSCHHPLLGRRRLCKEDTFWSDGGSSLQWEATTAGLSGGKRLLIFITVSLTLLIVIAMPSLRWSIDLYCLLRSILYESMIWI